jgi:hypothetical protein
MTTLSLNIAVLPWFLCIAVGALAQSIPEDRIPPEGYVDSAGDLVLPLRKVLANRKLMVRDMGSTFASCKEARPTLDQIKSEMFRREGSRLESRGYSLADYSRFWNEAYAEGIKVPVPAEKCPNEQESWKLMLKNIQQE